jgi:prepilin-type N-terminal cleavage/methylation domain-containing protein
MKKRTARQGAFTLVEIMIVVAIIGLLASIAIPNFVKARTTAQMHACISNLQQIDGAIQMWATETKQGETATVTAADILPYLKNSVTCPSGGGGATFATSYSVSTVQAKPTCLKVPATHKLDETLQ